MKKIAKNIISTCGHIGTHKYNWQPESERFAIGYRNSVLIYNISTTNFYLNRACFFVENLIYKYGRLYIYGLDKKNDKKFIKKFNDLNQVVTTQKWSGGFVTNARVFRGKIKNLKKKFAAVLGLYYNYQNYSLPREAKIINLPCIGVVDSNANAGIFTYPIPINSNNFGVARLMAYTFAIKIFKGISKRILSRFKKKLKISSKKIKKKKKKKYLLRKYFKKIKKKIKKKKKNFKKKLKIWSKKYKLKFFKFKKKILNLSKLKAQKDYIKKDNQKWITLEAALRYQKVKEKIRKLPKRKIKKFIRKKIKLVKKPIRKKKFKKLGISNDRKLGQKKIKKKISYLRIKKRVRKKILLAKKKVRVKKRRSRKKKNRYRPNKKWKPWFKNQNKFKFKKKSIRFISKFQKIGKKLIRLKKLKVFRNSVNAINKSKNPKYIYRILKKSIKRYKLRKIYKYLYKKKKKLILKRKRMRARRKQRGGIRYNLSQDSSSYNKYKDNRKYYQKNNYNFEKNYNYYNNNSNKDQNKRAKNYRYYYKDFAYVKKPKKKKNFY